MIDKHLSEAEIQDYALDESSCAPEVISHVRTCHGCQARAAAYKMLFSGITQQPRPAFDFDLSAAVLSKITTKKTSPATRGLTGFGIIFSIIAGLGVGGWLYRIKIASLYKTYILSIISGVSKMVIYFMVITVCCFLIFQLAEMYKKYQRKMEGLNIY
jgi:hypothetical protein